MTGLCRHFGTCGGCAFQDMTAGAYRVLKQAGVEKTLATHGIEASVAPLAETPPATRRRASLKAAWNGGELAVGFNAARSHAIVDMRECRVLTPALAALVQELRELLRRVLEEKEQAGITVQETDSGVDLALELPEKHGSRHTALLAEWARRRNVARISINGEMAVHLASPAIRVGASDVLLPPGTFLQPSREGEQILQSAVLDVVQEARRIVDLFAGCGTFTLVLAQYARVHAVDLDGKALGSLGDAARKTPGLKPVTTETRDLFKRPLRPGELDSFEAVVIDPPRAGARAQSERIAESRLSRLAYVSCNPETFARDAAILTNAGFHMTRVKPVDQFLWSKHIELVGAFERKPGWSRRHKN